jgi:hypothetical protein
MRTVLEATNSETTVGAARRVMAKLAEANRRADSYKEQWESNPAFTKQAGDDAKKAEADNEALRAQLEASMHETKQVCEQSVREAQRAERAESERDAPRCQETADLIRRASAALTRLAALIEPAQEAASDGHGMAIGTLERLRAVLRSLEDEP